MNDFIGDSIKAVEFVENLSYVNSKYVIPCGHSQGASIAPFIAAYLNKIAAMSLMGAGITINKVIDIQMQEYGYPNSTIKQTDNSFTCVLNGTCTGYQQVYVLGSPGPAAFWLEWIDIDVNVTKYNYLSQLNYYFTLNSPTDTNVPPETYIPLHNIVDSVCQNGFNLTASMNVIPNLIHEMVTIQDVENGIYTVSTQVLDLLVQWVNSVFGT